MTKYMNMNVLFKALAVVAVSLPLTVERANADQKIIRAVIDADVKVIDPVVSTSYSTRTFGYMVYDTLFSRDASGNYQPQMLESYTLSADAMTYTFKLRQGLTWHDGKPVTAADCVASIKRWAKRDALGGAMMAASASLEANDAHTFTLKLAKPFGLVIDALGKESANVPFMMPQRLAETDATKALTEAVGSGPFMFKQDEWQPGNKSVYVKNPNYKPRSEPASGLAGGKVVKVDRVEFRVLDDSASAMAALSVGEIDYMQFPPFDLLRTIKNNKDVKLVNPGGLGNLIGIIRLNHLYPPLNNPKVRQALQMAMDRNEIQAAIGVPEEFRNPDCLSFFLCGTPYEASAGTEPYRKPSIEKAKALLKEAGYNGEKLYMLHATNMTNSSNAGNVIEDQFRRAGINVEVVLGEWNTILARRNSKETPEKGGWSTLVTALSGYDIGSPVSHYYIANTCNPNYAGWSCDEPTKKYLEEFSAEPDLAKRKALAEKINERSYENLPALLYGQYSQPYAHRSEVSGLIVSGIPVFWNAEKK